jgi:RNA polymerase sigma-70 factor, ECF subfamily
MEALSLATCSLGESSVCPSDGELVNAVLGGDRKAFAILIERYEPSVGAVTLSILKDAHLAQDAAQDAFVKAYEKLDHLRRAGAFGPWLLKIARRCALNMGRRPRSMPISEHDVGQEAPTSLLDEDRERLLAAIVRLRASERQVVMLRYFKGHSVKEVAEMVGRNVGTVTKQLSRAHARLRALLGEA